MFIISSFILDLYGNDRDRGDGKCGRRSKSRRRAAKGCQLCRRSRNNGTDGEGLHTIMDALSKTGKEYDMNINVIKTKAMRVCSNGRKREGGNIQQNDRRTMGEGQGEKKDFEQYIRIKKAMAWTHLERRKSG